MAWMANTLHEPRMQPLGNTFLHYKEHSSVATRRSRSFSDYVTYRQCQRVGYPGYSQSLHNGAPTNDLKAALAMLPAGAGSAGDCGALPPKAHSAPASPVCTGFDDKASCNLGSAAVVPGVGARQRSQGKDNDPRAAAGREGFAERAVATGIGPSQPAPAEDDHYLAADKPSLSNSPPRDSSTDAGSPRSGHSDEDKYTTLMIRNLPYDLEQSDVVEELDRSGYKDLYDFVYMPCTFQSGRGKGYAFVNFEAHEDAANFVRYWHKSRRFRMSESSQSLNISVAAVQGREDNVRKWDVPRMRRVKNPGYRPLVAMYAMTKNGIERQLVPNAVVPTPTLKANKRRSLASPGRAVAPARHRAELEAMGGCARAAAEAAAGRPIGW